MRKFRRPVVVVVLLMAGWGGASLAWHKFRPKSVVAEATLEVFRVTPDFETLSLRSEPIREGVRGDRMSAVHIKIDGLTYERTLRSLVEHASIRETQWYAQFGGDDEAAMSALGNGAIAVEPITGSARIRLRVTVENREDALILLRQWIEIERDAADHRIDAYYFDDFRQFLLYYQSTVMQIGTLRDEIRSCQAEYPNDAPGELQSMLDELTRLEARKENADDVRRDFDLRLWRDHYLLEVHSEPVIVEP